jgi:glycosyltransferase involved in cell wall biosynthesis
MICQRAIEDKQYDGFVAKAKQIKNLEFIQRVPFHQIHEHFLQAKVFVNTSEYEGFPNTFIQACKCATPILSLNVNPDGFLNEYKCGICCNSDWEKFVDSLRGMLRQEQRTELGKNARKYAEKNHDITKIIGIYKKLFAVLKPQTAMESKQ